MNNIMPLALDAAPVPGSTAADGIAVALEGIADAGRRLTAIRSANLAGVLPDLLEGWSPKITEDPAQGPGFSGGGSVAEARYAGTGGSCRIICSATRR